MKSIEQPTALGYQQESLVQSVNSLSLSDKQRILANVVASGKVNTFFLFNFLQNVTILFLAKCG